jgi:hypothetical protein
MTESPTAVTPPTGCTVTGAGNGVGLGAGIVGVLGAGETVGCLATGTVVGVVVVVGANVVVVLERGGAVVPVGCIRSFDCLADT